MIYWHCNECGVRTNTGDAAAGLCVGCSGKARSMAEYHRADTAVQQKASAPSLKGVADELVQALDLCLAGPEDPRIRVVILRDAIRRDFPIGRTLGVLRALNEIGGAM